MLFLASRRRRANPLAVLARASLALAVLLAAAAPGPARGGGPCRLAVRVEPAFLELGTGASAVVRVTGASDQPTLTVNAGRLERLRREGEGWTADYAPPEETFPRVAMVAALAGEACGHAALPLHGAGDAMARTRPHRVVEVRIGDRTFEPVRADARGRAVVPVTVPPGVRVAWHGKQSIPLHPPKVPQLHLALGRGEARADLAGEVTVLAVAVAEDGSPWQGAAPALEVSEGALEPWGPQGPDAFRWRWRLAPGVPRTARLSASLQAGLPPPPVELRRPAGPPARAELVASAPRAAPGAAIALRVKLTDLAGNAADGTPVLRASAGRVEEPSAAGPGAWRALLVVPERFEGERTVVVTGSAGEATGQAVLELEPGPATRAELSPPAGPVPADGESEVSLPLAVTDAFGNPVEGVPEVSAERGQVAAEQDGRGWRLRYRAPRLDGAAEETVRANLGQAQGEARFPLARRPRSLDLSLRLGAAIRSGNPVGPEVGISAVHFPLGLRRKLGFGLGLTWSSLSRRDQLSDGDVPVALETRADFLALEGVARFRQGLGGRMLGWAELGGGGALAATRLTQPRLPALGARRFVPLVHGALALGHQAGPFLEARATLQGDAGSEALQGSLKTFTLSAGWRLEAR